MCSARAYSSIFSRPDTTSSQEALVHLRNHIPKRANLCFSVLPGLSCSITLISDCSILGRWIPNLCQHTKPFSSRSSSFSVGLLGNGGLLDMIHYKKYLISTPQLSYSISITCSDRCVFRETISCQWCSSSILLISTAPTENISRCVALYTSKSYEYYYYHFLFIVLSL